MQIYQHFQHQKKSCQSCTCRNCRNRIAESWGYNFAILFWVAETAEAAADSISKFCRNFCWYLVISAFYIAQLIKALTKRRSFWGQQKRHLGETLKFNSVSFLCWLQCALKQCSVRRRSGPLSRQRKSCASSDGRGREAKVFLIDTYGGRADRAKWAKNRPPSELLHVVQEIQDVQGVHISSHSCESISQSKFWGSTKLLPKLFPNFP